MSRLLVICGLCHVCLAAEPSRDSVENGLLENVRLRPSSFRDSHLLGEYYAQIHRFDRAVVFLERASEIDPGDYPNRYDLALAYLQSGRSDKSRDIIVRMMAYADKAELHGLLGDVEESEGRFPEAIREYETAVRIEPSEKNLFDLGSELLLHGAFEPALKVFEVAAVKDASSPRVQVGFGIAYYSLGQYDKAVEHLCHAVDLDPHDRKALEFLGKMYDVSPTYADEVTLRLENLVRLYPQSAAANYYYAVALRKRADPEHRRDKAAEVCLLKSIQLSPEFAEAHFALGLLYEDQLKTSKAIVEYERAKTLEPDVPKTHYRLAHLYRKAGRLSLARREFDAASALKEKR